MPDKRSNELPERGRKINWDSLIHMLRQSLKSENLPSVSQVAARSAKKNPYRVLISTIISLRTKDEVTLAASERLFKKAHAPAALSALDEKEIQSLIYPAGFYKTKAKHLKRIARILIDEYDSKVPSDQDKLLALPGVGRKTANLVLNLGFGIPAICVDTHVHRVSNRIGWVKTKTPGETEFALMEILPEKHWIEINEILVQFGQNICTPMSPHCSRCPVSGRCLKVGVVRSR